MNKVKAEKLVKRKIARASLCPFCGKTPEFEAGVADKMSARGSIGHLAKRNGCCYPTGLGQTELFFTKDFRAPNYRLWKCMVDRLVDDWNRRV